MKQVGASISAHCERAIEKHIFPGCVVGVITAEKESALLPCGYFTYDLSSPKVANGTVYDVASVTKSIPTSLLALKLVEEKKLLLDQQLIHFVPEYRGSYRKEITIAHLLMQRLSFPFSLSSFSSSDEIIQNIFHAELKEKPGDQYGYANATSILLGMVIEKVTRTKLPKLARDIFFSPLGMTSSTFFPREPASVPPTELVDGKTIQGIVHDESARILFENGVVTGSAGLFSNARDLLTILQMLLQDGIVKKRRFFKQQTIELMIKRQLGWQFNQAWMGKKYSQKAFGKTGFTGCFVFCDLEKRVGIVLLANHIFPKRRETKESMNRFRAGLIDLVLSNRMV